MENLSILSTYECLTKFREPLFISIINSLNIPLESHGLDAGCAIGKLSNILANPSDDKKRQVIGIDISKDFINYATKLYPQQNTKFSIGDIKHLEFNDNTFDWIWSVDTIWIGPKEFGCIADNPINIMQEFYRVLKSGGKLFLVFWSSQKFLSGYPILEAQLNATSSGTAPFTPNMNPNNHIFNTKSWYKQANFRKIQAKTYLQNIAGPLDNNTRKAVDILMKMLWEKSQSEVHINEWKKFQMISNPNNENYILDNPNYYGFFTYTLFQGEK